MVVGYQQSYHVSYCSARLPRGSVMAVMAHPKAALLNYLQKNKLGRAEFVTTQSGPAHDPVFTSEVQLGQQVLGKAQGTSKRQAERRAAAAALEGIAKNGVDLEEFNGPWPVFEEVLATTIRVAERRVSADLRGEDAEEAIREFALTLYKNVLQDLGELVPDDD